VVTKTAYFSVKRDQIMFTFVPASICAAWIGKIGIPDLIKKRLAAAFAEAGQA